MSAANRVRDAARGALLRVARPAPAPADLLVVAPHPDDETLGCAARILRARRHGARVTVVVATDGAGSHDVVGADRAALIERRRAELQTATAQLGVDPADVIVFDHPDGGLAAHEPELSGQLASLIADRRPAEVCVTSTAENHPDHAAAGRAARAAVGDSAIRLLEYPVWLWSDWPLSRRFATGRGLAQFTGLLARRAIEIVPFDEGDSALKSAALEAYASQLGADSDQVALPRAVIDRALASPELYFRVGGVR